MSSALTTTKKPRARPISQVEWEKYQNDIEELYVNQGKSLEKVAAVLHKRHEFNAQKCQYKAQIARWGFKKNTSRKERSWIEKYLSMQPSKEQREYWISRRLALLPLDTLGYRRSLRHLVLLSAANEMFLEGNSDLVEHLQQKATAPLGRPYNFTQISDDSPTGLILGNNDLDHYSWMSVLFSSAKIVSIMTANHLNIPICATPEHHCCPKPTWREEEFSPQCQQLFNQSTMTLLLGLLFAPEIHSWLGRLARIPLLRSALALVDDTFPEAMRHAKRLKRNVEGKRSDLGLDSDTKFEQWYDRLTDLLDEVMDQGFVIEYRDKML